MAVRLYVNNFSTKLTAQLLSGGTTANITTGDGATLAGANGVDYFVGTLRRMSGFRDVAREIVRITNRSSDALTITRAQESTTALQFEIGDQLDIDFTATSFSDTVLSAFPAADAGGTVDAITATFSPALTLSDLTLCAVVSAGANTSATPSFAPNGLTAHTITKQGGQPLVAGDIAAAGFVALLEYNLANTRWELLNPAVAVVATDILTLTAAPSDQGYSGDVVALTYGESLIPGDVVYIKSDGAVWKADANAAGLYPAMGLALETASSGSHLVLLRGIYRDDARYAWTVGGVVYLSTTAGTATQTAPTATDDVTQVLGIATHADRIYFNPSLNIVTHT